MQFQMMNEVKSCKYNLLLNSRLTIGIELKNYNFSETYCSDYKNSFVDLDDRVSGMIQGTFLVPTELKKEIDTFKTEYYAAEVKKIIFLTIPINLFQSRKERLDHLWSIECRVRREFNFQKNGCSVARRFIQEIKNENLGEI